VLSFMSAQQYPCTANGSTEGMRFHMYRFGFDHIVYIIAVVALYHLLLVLFCCVIRCCSCCCVIPFFVYCWCVCRSHTARRLSHCAHAPLCYVSANTKPLPQAPTSQCQFIQDLSTDEHCAKALSLCS
jgi:hypothetical protein